MTNDRALDTITDAAVADVERRGRDLSKADYYRLLDRVMGELAIRQEGTADDLRNEGIDPRGLE